MLSLQCNHVLAMITVINRLIIYFTGVNQMNEVKDYTSPADACGNTHYNGVPSEFGRRVESQNKMQPKYCEPGEAGGEMRGERRNEQAGP
jgi:hypothetical protein